MPTDITSQIEQHFSQYPLRSYPKGQILIHAGEDPEHIYYLVKGKVRQYDISYRGDEIVVNVFKSGAFFPMIWAITGTQNNYFFDAETSIEVRAAPAEATVDYLKANPDVMFDLLTRLYRGMEGVLGRMVQLMSGSAKSRVLYELLIEGRRFGKLAEDDSCRLSINEGELAARAGLSRETVSREMQKLSHDGLVKVTPSGILIKHMTNLEERLSAEL
jgi:CRP/FNR family cyclic AMP-dependent transcriptional regulator